MTEDIKKTKKQKKNKITFDKEAPENVHQTLKNQDIELHEQSDQMQNKFMIKDITISEPLKKSTKKQSKRKKNKHQEVDVCASNDTLDVEVESSNSKGEGELPGEGNVCIASDTFEIEVNKTKRKKNRHREKKEVSLPNDTLEVKVEDSDSKEKTKKHPQEENMCITNEDFKMDLDNTSSKRKKSKHREKQEISATATNDALELAVENVNSKRKKKKHLEKEIVQTNNELENGNQTNLDKKESKRGKKRKKQMELILDKKIKTDINIQERSLNYLSKWKHSPNEWKFEKKRQVWLQQNMFNHEKVSDDFWETLTEYFSKSKGNIRKNILDEALKIVDQNGEKEDDVLINRARSIIQCLQE